VAAVYLNLCNLRDKDVTQFSVLMQKGVRKKYGRDKEKGRKRTKDEDMKEMIPP
jgi:hypothetical protein